MSDMNEKEIERLKKDLENIKNTVEFYKGEKRKEFWERNKRLLTIFAKYILPYLATFSIVIGLFKLSNNGVPFFRDDIKKYKEYTLDYKSDEIIEIKSHYIRVIKNKGRYLKISEPWKFNGTNYERIVKEVVSFINPNNELFESIINEDINRLNELCSFNESIEYCDDVNLDDNDYLIDAVVSFYDMDDFIVVEETPISNLVSTIMQMSIGLVFSNIIAGKIKKDGRFTDEIVNLNDNYNRASFLLESGLIRIKEKEEMILSLEKGGNKNV